MTHDTGFVDLDQVQKSTPIVGADNATGTVVKSGSGREDPMAWERATPHDVTVTAYTDNHHWRLIAEYKELVVTESNKLFIVRSRVSHPLYRPRLPSEWTTANFAPSK